MSGVSTGEVPVIVLFPSDSDCERIIISDAHLRYKEEDMNEGLFGSVEIIVFHNVLGGINRRRKARIDWRNHINGFDLSAVPLREGQTGEDIHQEIFEL
jgi:hypothetical protein